jgi:hypothetical protein
MKNETIEKVMALLQADTATDDRDMRILAALAAIGDDDGVYITRQKMTKRDLTQVTWAFDRFHITDWDSGAAFASAIGLRVANGWQVSERFGWAEYDGSATTGGQYISYLWWKDTAKGGKP